MKNTFVNDCFDLAKEIENEAYYLNGLSEAFKQTGNDFISAKLYRRVENLGLVAEKIRKLCAERVDADLKNANDSAGNTLKFCLGFGEKKEYVTSNNKYSSL